MKMMTEQFKRVLLLLTESEASKLRGSLGLLTTSTKNHHEHCSARTSRGDHDSGTRYLFLLFGGSHRGFWLTPR
jgi:hypothetical protein